MSSIAYESEQISNVYGHVCVWMHACAYLAMI